ncbi:MAG: DUF5320 domain-containing protein [Candidatus Methanofastidiosia archaeon]
MPRFDGTGPRGRGPLTGRGMGYCVIPVSGSVTGYTPVSYRSAPVQNGYPYPAFSGMRRGRGMGSRGRGRGFGRGRRNRPW